MAVVKNCLYCQSEFKKPECRIKTGRGKYCSKNCANKARVGTLVGEQNPSWKGGISNTPVACNYCKETFWTSRARISQGRGKFCSYNCYYKSFDYGKTELHERLRKCAEYKLWRKSVFERDDYTCVWCFKRGGELHADHIKPFSFYPELRLAIDNGRTLCINCHKKTDTYGIKQFHVDEERCMIAQVQNL